MLHALCPELIQESLFRCAILAASEVVTSNAAARIADVDESGWLAVVREDVQDNEYGQPLYQPCTYLEMMLLFRGL